MNFSSSIFIYVFMPIFVLIYLFSSWLSNHVQFIRKLKLADAIVVLASLVFYMWACFDNVFFLIFLIVSTWIVGKIISSTRTQSLRQCLRSWIEIILNASFAKILMILAIVSMVILLYQFKYKGEVSVGLSNIKNMATPIGISFLTFSIISYIVDVYKGASAGSFLEVAFYISFFPKVISGPIVLWENFQVKLKERKVNLENIEKGILRIIYGLAKKVILADYFGSVIYKIQDNAGVGGIDTATAWLICILYMMQIYYDFAGYSDIAIGLSIIIGLNIEDNFNFPYISTSITEFWRRWHISLGLWFRKYVYIPLGGNRKGKIRALLNSFIVMVISGIWHGAGLGYLFWGMGHGICMVFEKSVSNKKWYMRTPKIIKWFITMFIVMLGWEIFRCGTFSGTFNFIKMLIGINNAGTITFTYQYYFTIKLAVMLLIGILGSTIFNYVLNSSLYCKYKNTVPVLFVKYVAGIVLFVLVLVCIANSTYSPFIYFQY